MRRNLGNELIVALLAAASILFAAAFAVLLSTSTSQRPTVEPTEPTMQAATPAATTTQTSPPTTIATISVTPQPPVASATSTPVEEITEVAPANLTLTAIRETAVARREQATARPSSTPVEEETRVAPANLTLTAIRETVVARRELALARPSPTADEPISAATATATKEIASVTPEPPVASATSTPLEEPAQVAPANLTLTAIRETAVTRREQTTTSPSPTSAEPVSAATATATKEITSVTPEPPVASATSTPVEEETRVTPANLTLTAIRETVVARREMAAARPSPAATKPVRAATETALPATEAMASVTPQLPLASATSTPVEEPTEVAPANLTLTAIGEMLLATRPTPVQAPVSHLTPLPDYLIYLIPTPTAFGAIEDSFRSDCEIERDWLSYELKEGDTLLSLALSTESSLIELRDGNCYTPVRGIFAGERLRVPRLPASPAARPAPIALAGDEAAEVIGCDRTLAQILLPAPHAQVEGVFAIIGSAHLPGGGRYRLAVKPGWSEVYYPYLESDVAVGNDVLALVNTEIFGLGAHRVQLAVADSDGELIEGGICEIPIMFGSP